MSIWKWGQNFKFRDVLVVSITISYIFCALGQEQFPEAWVASRAKNVVPNKKNMIYFQALGHHWVVDVPKEELHSLMLYIN